MAVRSVFRFCLCDSRNDFLLTLIKTIFLIVFLIMVSYLRNSILATIVYYDVFEYPLTLMEVYSYLINPARLHRLLDGVGEIKLYDIAKELEKLAGSKIISQKNGFYFLPGPRSAGGFGEARRDGLYDLRSERSKRSAQQWKKFLRLSKWLAITPYMEGFFGSGSFALENMNEKSDLDVLIIAKAGRLYTCRFFLVLISSILGVRRKPFDRVAPGKLCLNHYITGDDLRIRHESMYTAQLYVNLKPVFISPELLERFFGANIWLNNYVYNFKPSGQFVRRTISSNFLSRLIVSGLEFILNSPVGGLFESTLKKYQQERIRKNPLTGQPGGRVVFTDQELEFHPHSSEKNIIARYLSGLRRLGIIPFIEEHDSGLTQ